MTPQWLIRALRAVGIGRASFEPGQVWRYATRTGEEQSRVWILSVETHPRTGEPIVHIAISDVRLRAAGELTTIGHIPISREALEASGVMLEATGAALPDFEEGYRMWRKAFDAGEAGVFSIPVAEVVGALAQTVEG